VEPDRPQGGLCVQGPLGAEENRNLLVHFLNAVLDTELAAPLVAVEILNPYNAKEFRDEKLSIVDIKARDEKGAVLGDRGGIWVLELGKFEARAVASERDRWLKFFEEGEYLDSGCLPGWMDTAEMEQAMTVMNRFSEAEAEYHRYQARQN